MPSRSWLPDELIETPFAPPRRNPQRPISEFLQQGYVISDQDREMRNGRWGTYVLRSIHIYVSATNVDGLCYQQADCLRASPLALHVAMQCPLLGGEQRCRFDPYSTEDGQPATSAKLCCALSCWPCMLQLLRAVVGHDPPYHALPRTASPGGIAADGGT